MQWSMSLIILSLTHNKNQVIPLNNAKALKNKDTIFSVPCHSQIAQCYLSVKYKRAKV